VRADVGVGGCHGSSRRSALPLLMARLGRSRYARANSSLARPEGSTRDGPATSPCQKWTRRPPREPGCSQTGLIGIPTI
jgi:hypothetical protein